MSTYTYSDLLGSDVGLTTHIIVTGMSKRPSYVRRTPITRTRLYLSHHEQRMKCWKPLNPDFRHYARETARENSIQHGWLPSTTTWKTKYLLSLLGRLSQWNIADPPCDQILIRFHNLVHLPSEVKQENTHQCGLRLVERYQVSKGDQFENKNKKR